MTRQTVRPLVLVALVILMAGIALEAKAAGIQLITMRNGRVLKAISVTQDGTWVTAVLTSENEIGFPVEYVERIEEDPVGNPEEIGESLNIVTGGRETGRRGSFRAPQPAAGNNPLTSSQQRQVQQEAQQGAVGGVVRDGRGVQPNPTPGTVQPANPSGGLRNRRVNRLRNRDQNDN